MHKRRRHRIRSTHSAAPAGARVWPAERRLSLSRPLRWETGHSDWSRIVIELTAAMAHVTRRTVWVRRSPPTGVSPGKHSFAYCEFYSQYVYHITINAKEFVIRYVIFSLNSIVIHSMFNVIYVHRPELVCDQVNLLSNISRFCIKQKVLGNFYIQCRDMYFMFQESYCNYRNWAIDYIQQYSMQST